MKRLTVGAGVEGGPLSAVIAYIEGLVNETLLDEHVLRPMMGSKGNDWLVGYLSMDPGMRPESVMNTLVTVKTSKAEDDWRTLMGFLLAGHVLLFLEGCPKAVAIHLPGFEYRSISTPLNEQTLFGPKDSFTEVLRVNTALIRRRIRDEGLRFEDMTVGTRTATDTVIAYIDGLASKKVLGELQSRLDRINNDRLIDTYQLASYLEDSKWSPLPLIITTERPDVVCMNLLEGRVALLSENSSSALILPVTIRNFMMAPEDYYARWYVATFVRLLRIIAVLAALLLPALYIALTSFHPELLPVKLMISIGASRLNVPLPSILEALLLTLALELLTEASVRMPGIMGATIGVVGGLIIGQAAVNSGLVSAGMVVVISVTAIGTFVLPKLEFSQSLRYLRFAMIFAAWGWGLFGLTLAVVLLIAHLCALRSFGVPYTSPMVPLELSEMDDDILLKLPFSELTHRSRTARPHDTVKAAKPEE